MYKNRVIGHLDRIFPGLILTKAAPKNATSRCSLPISGSVRPCRTWCASAPTPENWSPCRQPACGLFFTNTIAAWDPTPPRIIAYAQKVLWPDPEVVAIRRQILATDLQTLDQVSARIAHYSEQLQQMLAQTPYQFLTQVKGLSPIALPVWPPPSVIRPTTAMPASSFVVPAWSAVAMIPAPDSARAKVNLLSRPVTFICGGPSTICSMA